MDDADLLRQAGCSHDVVAHCMAVAKLAQAIAERVRVPVGRELVRQGALFHDIGRSRTHDINHALEGVRIGRSLNFAQPLLDIIERHIGAGITAKEAIRLGLPEKDYLPLTAEEKIVSYADNLLSGVREMRFEEALERFKRILGRNHEGVELFVQQHHEIQAWVK